MCGTASPGGSDTRSTSRRSPRRDDLRRHGHRAAGPPGRSVPGCTQVRRSGGGRRRRATLLEGRCQRRTWSTCPADVPHEPALGGIDHTFWFDAATGIVLRHVGLADDEPWSITEFKEVRVNPPLTDLDFEFVAPPDGTVERRVDQLVRLAEFRGADLTGIDREDPRALQEAVDGMMRPDRPTPVAQLELQKAKHVRSRAPRRRGRRPGGHRSHVRQPWRDGRRRVRTRACPERPWTRGAPP